MKGHVTNEAALILLPGQVLWDDHELGFGVRRQRNLASFMVRYRQNRVRRHITLGTSSEVTADEARQKARIILDAAKNWATSEPPRWDVRRSKAGTIYFGEFAERYLHDFAAPRKKQASLRSDRRNLELHILPCLGHRRLIDINFRDISSMHASKCATPVAANRCLALLSHIFSMAEKWGIRPKGANPCRGVDRFPERPRESYFKDDELSRLGNALNIAERGYQSLDWSQYPLEGRFTRRSPEDWRALAAIRLLLLTGARMTEILSLKWDSIDRKRGIARLPDSKTGPKLLFFPDRANVLLEQVRFRVETEYNSSPFVLPSDRPHKHFQGLFKSWQRIRAIARLESLRIHDLRHVFASTAVSSGDSLYIVGRILGHRQPSTTQRYAHLDLAPMQAVVNRTADRLSQYVLI